jgi:hypothetical protein
MKLSVLSEGYGSVVNFKYDNWQHDPKPKVLLLGRYRDPGTRNINIGGINLNYLQPDQVAKLRKILPDILKPRDLKSRYWRGKALLPEVFDEYYRTYDQDYVGSVTRDTLKFMKPSELEAEPLIAPTPTAPAPTAPAAAAPAVPEVPEVAPGEKVPMPMMKEKPPVIEPSVADLLAAPPKPEEEPTTEPEKIETGLEKPQLGTEPAPEGGKETTPKVEPEMEAPPTGRGAVAPAAPKVPKLPKPKPKVPPDKKKGLTSAQRRQEKAKAMKKAIEVQKQTKPPVKPQPPDEIKGAMGLFKKKE